MHLEFSHFIPEGQLLHLSQGKLKHFPSMHTLPSVHSGSHLKTMCLQSHLTHFKRTVDPENNRIITQFYMN